MEKANINKAAGILLAAVIAEALLLGWAYFSFIQPVLSKLPASKKTAVLVMIGGAFYYSLSLIYFLLQPISEKKEPGVMHIMGKPFKPGFNITSAANHIILATGFIMAGIALIVSAS